MPGWGGNLSLGPGLHAARAPPCLPTGHDCLCLALAQVHKSSKFIHGTAVLFPDMVQVGARQCACAGTELGRSPLGLWGVGPALLKAAARSCNTAVTRCATSHPHHFPPGGALLD